MDLKIAYPVRTPIPHAIAQHRAAREAWGRASTAEGVGIARALSRAAVAASCPGPEWLEALDAACIDAEAEHAADLHAEAIKNLWPRCSGEPQQD